MPTSVTYPTEDQEADEGSRPGRGPSKVVLAVEKYFDLIGKVAVGEPVLLASPSQASISLHAQNLSYLKLMKKFPTVCSIV